MLKCIFVTLTCNYSAEGNDFLPCLPHMDIADGSLNLMMNVYRDMLPDLGGYITSKSSIHLPRLEMFIQEISRREPLYFQQRAIDDRDKNYAGDGYREHYYKVLLAYSLIIPFLFLFVYFLLIFSCCLLSVAVEVEHRCER